MKKYINSFLTFLLLFFAIPSYGEEGVIAMLNDGSTVEFAFTEKPVICVFGNTLSISTTHKSVSYEYSKIHKIIWNHNNATGTSNVKSSINNNIQFKLTNTGIETLGLRKGERVSLYTVSGILISSARSLSDKGSVLLPIRMGNGETYIVRTSTGVSYKFLSK